MPPALVRAAEVYVPGLDTASEEAVGEGISTTAFRMASPSGPWILRVSKSYPQPWIWHGGRGFEATLIRALETAGMPVPRDVAVLSADSTGLPSAFIERQVSGRPASADHLRTVQVASQLGAFLSHLHALPVEWCRSIGVRPGFYLTDLRDRIERASTQLNAQDRRSAEAAMKEIAASRPAETVLVHGDFRPEHWYVDDDGNLSAVIDCGDAALDDPALDFARLPTAPDTFASDLLRHYHGDRNGLVRRASLYRALEGVMDRLDGPVTVRDGRGSARRRG